MIESVSACGWACTARSTATRGRVIRRPAALSNCRKSTVAPTPPSVAAILESVKRSPAPALPPNRCATSSFKIVPRAVRGRPTPLRCHYNSIRRRRPAAGSVRRCATAERSTRWGCSSRPHRADRACGRRTAGRGRRDPRAGVEGYRYSGRSARSDRTCVADAAPSVRLLIGEFDVASFGFTSDSRRLTFIATIGRSQGTFGTHRCPDRGTKAARSTSRSLR
jgi:hypothetical protein